jgi:tryptophan synthase alpha chain
VIVPWPTPNTVLAPGAESFLERLAASGVAGLIVPDLPLRGGGASSPLRRPPPASRSCRWLRRRRPPERLAAIGARAAGFMYVVSVMGTTGERAHGATDLGPLLARAKPPPPCR